MALNRSMQTGVVEELMAAREFANNSMSVAEFMLRISIGRFTLIRAFGINWSKEALCLYTILIPRHSLGASNYNGTLSRMGTSGFGVCLSVCLSVPADVH